MAKSVVVIGGGAAGLMAARFALDAGAKVTLLEKNEKLGKKIYITGKGRCNLTNACDFDALMKQIPRNPRFMYSAFSLLDNQGIMRLFGDMGLALKTERGDRVFPVSDHASDVTNTLEKYLRSHGCRILLNTSVNDLICEDGAFAGVKTSRGEMRFDACVLATGGLSYPSTGSTGDGYRFLKTLGHSIVPCRPALTGIETEEGWCSALMGLSLKNVSLSAWGEKNGKRKKLLCEQGEMLFTHYGISGPIALSLSSALNEDYRGTKLEIDLKPAISEDTLDARLLREFARMPNKQLISCMDTLEPHALGEAVLSLADISPYQPINSVTQAQRKSIVQLLKAIPLTVKNLRGFDEAIITRGGVNVKEIDPSTLESRLVKGLYIAGEVLDVDAFTGGFNLTIAFSSGALAGKCASENG